MCLTFDDISVASLGATPTVHTHCYTKQTVLSFYENLRIIYVDLVIKYCVLFVINILNMIIDFFLITVKASKHASVHTWSVYSLFVGKSMLQLFKIKVNFLGPATQEPKKGRHTWRKESEVGC